MDNLESVAATVGAFARDRKDDERSQMAPTLLAIRAGRPAAIAFHEELSELLGAAGLVAGGYDADALALIFEGVFPLVPKNPITGQDWQKGEADEVRLRHDGLAQRWVTECQLISLVSRDLKATVSAQCFQLVGERVNWSEDIGSLRGTGVEQTLARAFAHPRIDPSSVPDPGERFVAQDGRVMSPERGRVSTDIGLTRILDTRFTAETPGGGAALIFQSEDDGSSYRSEGLMSWQCVIFSAGE